MNLIYKVSDKPKIGELIVFAFQQLLAILAATIAVPAIINSADQVVESGILNGAPMSQSAALFGAGVGTIVYLLFTRFKSPVFLGSSFAFLGSMTAAVAGAVSAAGGYLGLILGAVFAGLVYVVIAIVVKLAGTGWINKLMPPVVIGPTVAIIGLSLAGNAISDLTKGSVLQETTQTIVKVVNGVPELASKTVYQPVASIWIALLCGIVTMLVVILCSVYGKKMAKLIPFVIGIAAGYALAAIFTVIGNLSGNTALQLINFSLFENIKWIPDFSFIQAFNGNPLEALTPGYIVTVLVAYAPVAFVVFAEHIADHKNLSSVIGSDLTKEPGLHRTLLGDGIGSMVGAFFGGCPNTTYGESVGCVAITGNASVITIFCTAIFAILASFFGPFVTALATIPSCVMGGVCITLYGFIAVSGLKMLQKVDLNDNRNLFTASVILIAGVGGLVLVIAGTVTLTAVACALILGILVNFLVNLKGRNTEEK